MLPTGARLAGASLPWERGSPAAPEQRDDATPPALPHRQLRQASWRAAQRQAAQTRSTTDGTATDGKARVARLFRHIHAATAPELRPYQPSLFPLVSSGASGTESLGAQALYEPVDRHFKLPHGVFMKEATSVTVDSDDNVFGVPPPPPPYHTHPTRPAPAAQSAPQTPHSLTPSPPARPSAVFNRGNIPVLKFDRAGNLVDDFGNDTPYDGADMCKSPWPTDAFARPKDPGAGLVSRYRGTECERRRPRDPLARPAAASAG